MLKCNHYFKSQYCYIDNIEKNIKEYSLNDKDNIKCINNHQLIYVNGKKICKNGKKGKSYFKHKNEEDTFKKDENSYWHLEWQDNFFNTEIEFKKIFKNQIKSRRCDAYLKDYNIILEFQHSSISYNEVKERKEDYQLHNINIIWIIDGNDDTIEIIEKDNKICLKFLNNYWKYDRFIDYEYIFIDINKKIYKIYPNYVKNFMIDVSQPIDKKIFIEYLNKNNKIIYDFNIPLQCNLYIKQQGAGNGKTYGLIQMLDSEDFKYYKYFIIVSKQHSAKYIIYEEFNNQIKNNNLKYLKNIIKEENNKKFKISYINEKTNINCNITICTIDSLMYSLGNKNNDDINKFDGLVKSIIDGYIEEQNINHLDINKIKFRLNKELCLICDETQDLTKDYGKAIIKIMKDRYIDSYIVGDKLQSIKCDDNAFLYLYNNNFENENINKIIYEPTNICRRFCNNDLINFINNIIPFDKYNLPIIQPYKNNINTNKNITIFQGNNNNDNEEIEKIINYYKNEVINNNYKPNDFLIITPFTTNNKLIDTLTTAINQFWIDKNNNINIYEKYAIFHKSEEGTSIDLSESENSTRIVSIHTSKGDGRNIVFIIGLAEKSLLKYSNFNNNLIYDSLLHVSLTRMKEKLYIRLSNNYDDIYQKIIKNINFDDIIADIEPNLYNFSKCIKYNNDIINKSKDNEFFNLLLINIINNTEYLEPSFQINNNINIDMSHHNIRYASMFIYLFIKIIKNENKNNIITIKKQLRKIFEDIICRNIITLDKWQDYYKHINDNNDDNLCILRLSNNKIGDYNKYYIIIKKNIKNLQNKLKKLLITNNIDILCPLETIILYHMIQITQLGSKNTDITIIELYNIIDIYSKSFNCDITGHNNCICNKYFNNNIIKSNNMYNYLLNHYNDITKLDKLYDNFLLLNPKNQYLINHKIYFNSTNNDFEIYKIFQLIAYNDNDVFIIYNKPQFTELNYNEILIESIFDTFLFNNIKKPNNYNDNSSYNSIYENYIKFNNKNIIIVVFSINNDDYYTYKWNLKNNYNFIINHIKNILINKFTLEYINQFYNYFIYKKNIYINKNTDFSSKKIIRFIIKEYKDEYKNEDKSKDKHPEFILDFLKKIEEEIEDDDRDINEYDDINKFTIKLKKYIIKSINNYLDL